MKNHSTYFFATILLLLCLGSQSYFNFVRPLRDTTEGRYATVAKHMLDTKDFIIPKIPDDSEANNWLPYFSKPPLQIWLIVGSYSLFGESEFTARLPSFLAALFTVFLTALVTGQLWGKRFSLLSAVILASSAGFYFAGQVCLTDVTLTACYTLTMASLALLMNFNSSGDSDNLFSNRSRLWSIIFFCSLAFGVLCKGLTIIALLGTALVCFLVLDRKFTVFRCLEWKTGILMFLIIVLPWFILAEYKYPGFLKYFIVDEHLKRFLDPSFHPRYGSGHKFPFGFSWLFLLLLSFPWCLFFYSFARQVKNEIYSASPNRSLLILFLSFALGPAILFTLSRHILGTYLLPSLPALAILTAYACFHNSIAEFPWKRIYRITNVLMLISGIVLAGIYIMDAGINWGIALITGFIALNILNTFRSRYLTDITVQKGLYTFAVLITAFFMIAEYSLLPRFSPVRTAKIAMQHVEEEHLNNPVRFVYPFGVPYSAYFYVGKGNILSSEVADPIQNTLPGVKDVVVLTKKQWEKKLEPKIREQLIKLQSEGLEVIFEKH